MGFNYDFSVIDADEYAANCEMVYIDAIGLSDEDVVAYYNDLSGFIPEYIGAPVTTDDIEVAVDAFQYTTFRKAFVAATKHLVNIDRAAKNCSSKLKAQEFINDFIEGVWYW